MGGVTPHGIRYPDGASKAKNLGPELQTMAEDIDHVFTDTMDGSVIHEIVEGIAEEITPGIVNGVGAVTAFPTEDLPTSTRTALPVAWTNKTLNDPYRDTYTDTYGGTWENTSRLTKEVPLLTTAGTLSAAQIPDSIARVSEIPDISDIEEIVSTIPKVRRLVSPDFPIFAGRSSAARATGRPLPIVFAGSSSTARRPGYVTGLAEQLHTLWPEGTASGIQWSPTAGFTERTTPGVHVYNAAASGARAGWYLTDEESDKIAALAPAVIIHVIGANDYTDQTNPGTYRATLEARLEYLDDKMQLPCQHILVHAYARKAFTPPTYPNSDYGDALRAIAESRVNAGFIDYSAAFAANGVPGADPLNLISSDNIHPDDDGKGNNLIEDTIAAQLLN